MIKEYYNILGVSSQADLQEIKRAYRNKAKKLHPDVNPSSDAHQQFVILNKAYEYICNFKEGKITNAPYRAPVYKAKTETTYNRKTSYDGRRNWSEEELEKARAKIRSEKVKKEAEDKRLESNADKIGLVVLFSFFIASLFFNRTSSFFLLILILVFNWKKWKKYNDQPLVIQIKIWYKSLLPFINSPFFSLLFSVFFSIIVFFTIALNTLIPIHYTLTMYFTVFFIPFVVAEYLKKNKNHWIKSFVFPLLFNLFFAFNFTFSNNISVETYLLNNTTEEESTLIILENNAYEDYIGLRLFFDYQEITGNEKVSFQFEEGLFGLKVLKGYKFLKKDKFISWNNTEI